MTIMQAVVDDGSSALPKDVCEMGFDFWQHWLSLRRSGEILPSLKTFLLNPNPKTQPNTLIVDMVSESELLVRLFGTNLVKLGNVELTGKNLLEYATPQMALEMSELAGQQLSRPCGIHNLKLGQSASGLNSQLDIITLPVIPFENGPPCLVSCIELIDEIPPKDYVEQLWWYIKSEWIDLGEGVPPQYQHRNM